MNTIESAIDVAGGSVVGRAHRRLGRGGQDAFAWRRIAGGVVAVVCDGCGSGAHSEVGAALGARLWSAIVAERLAGGALDAPGFWCDARDAVLAQLSPLVTAIGGDREQTVRDCFLFTTVIAAWTQDRAAIAAIGDGVYAVDGDVHVLGPFADNQPPYAGYGLVTAPPAFTALDVRPADAMSAIAIASDGAAAFLDPDARDAGGAPLGAFTQFTAGDRWFTNPDAVRRRLAVVNREELRFEPARGAIVRRGAVLDDDTTIVVLRRRVA